jgi:hypothetical protein
MPSYATPEKSTLCSSPDCGKPLRARGFCVACYYRFLRRGDLISGTQTKRFRHRLTEVNETERLAVCAECGPVKIRKKGQTVRNLTRWRCAVDANHRSKLYKQAYRASKRAQMSDRCDVCGSAEDLCWDHDHTTGLFRGTLCDKCNLALGLLEDSADRCLSMAKYLARIANE